MEKFRIREGSFAEIKKKVVFRTIPLVLLVFAAGYLITEYNSKGEPINPRIWLMALPVGIITISIGIFNGLNNQKKIFESFELIIEDEVITRKQKNTPDIVFNRSDIISINKNVNGSYTIKGKGVANIIGIPAQIDNQEKLEFMLQIFSPIKKLDKSSPFEIYALPLCLIMLSAMVTVYIGTNKLLVGIAGLLVTSLLIYSLIIIQQGKIFDKSMKRKSWLIILPLLSILVSVYIKLF